VQEDYNPELISIKMNDKERLDYLNKQLGTSYESLDDVDWNYISIYQNLSESFIREFKDMVKWNWISEYQKLSEDFIREFSDRVVWGHISQYQELSEGFIREFKDKVNWACVSSYQKLSDDFIREFSDMVDWYQISARQELSEDFIREFKHKVNWSDISIYQKLSEDFIREFKGDVSWYLISSYQKLSDGFIREFKYNLDLDSIARNWAYKDAEFLKAQVEKTGLYECHDDYFIAYKGIRSDRYSKYNFQYQYLPGETYESFCDCSSSENSFGLSVWTEEKAKEYSDELVVKVKVRYEDVGRVVHNGGKIRCRKITILD
jgi:hypothetical protein